MSSVASLLQLVSCSQPVFDDAPVYAFCAPMVSPPSPDSRLFVSQVQIHGEKAVACWLTDSGCVRVTLEPLEPVLSLTPRYPPPFMILCGSKAALGEFPSPLSGKITYLASEGPDAIMRAVEQEEREIRDKMRLAASLSAELSEMAMSQNYSIPKIKFVQERDLSDYLHKQMETWMKNGKRYDNTWWGYQDHSFTEQYEEFIESSWKFDPSVKVRFFSNRADIEGEMEKRHGERRVRPLPPGNEFDSSLWVAGDYILMVRTREKPHYLVEIYDPVLARNQRQLFKMLWDSAKETQYKAD